MTDEKLQSELQRFDFKDNGQLRVQIQSDSMPRSGKIHTKNKTSANPKWVDNACL